MVVPYLTRKEAALTDDILVRPTTWACDIPHDWSTIPPLDCENARAHFHADCERCRYKPETCQDCRDDKCRRCYDGERVWAPTPEEARVKMRAHWAAAHNPAEVAEAAGLLF